MSDYEEMSVEEKEEEVEAIKRELVEGYGFDEEELESYTPEELVQAYEDVTDTSDMHPHETHEEFMEHENFGV